MSKIEEQAINYALPQSKYKLAKKRYEAIASLLASNSVDCKIYPQGSFSYGAITKPYEKNEDFDLDLIIEFPNYEGMYPKKIMDDIAKILKSDGRYADKIKEHDNGFTIVYSGDFNMDIIPAKAEEYSNKVKIMTSSSVSQYYNDAIQIPKFNKVKYSYVHNNPKGFKQWFDGVNSQSLSKTYVYDYKRNLYESAMNEFSSIDEIPDDYVVSPLQKVIIFLKRSRDVHYSRIKSTTKPLSGLLCLLACKAVEYKPGLGFDDTLRVVLDYIETLSAGTITNSLHKNSNGQWELLNPVDCLDNLADNWYGDTNAALNFFNFISKLKRDIYNQLNECKITDSVLNNILGIETVSYTNVSNGGKPWNRKFQK